MKLNQHGERIDIPIDKVFVYKKQYANIFTMASLMNKNPYVGMLDRITFLLDTAATHCGATDAISDLYINQYLDEVIWLMREYPRRLKLKQQIDRLTDEQIEQARQFPVDKLIVFEKGKALAFCHEDNRPSLHWYKKSNRARCFVCNRTWNPIDILMARGYSFSSSIKELI